MSEQYLGNPNLKKANQSISWTKDQILEFVRCKEDPVYFARRYIKIVSLDEGLVPFNMYEFQEKLIRNFHENRFNICKMPRQTGKSTTCVSYLLHYAVFNDNVNIAILANKASTARDLLGRLQLAYENLPSWMQQGIISWNKGSLELENETQKFRQTLLLHLLSVVDRTMSSFLTNSHSSRTTSLMTSLPLFILLFLLVKAPR